MVDVNEMHRLIAELGEPFLVRTFTEGELAASLLVSNRDRYLSERFAAKEALFKALLNRADTVPDFRRVETTDLPDGRSFFVLPDSLLPGGENLRIDRLHVSVSAVSDFAFAFVVAEGQARGEEGENHAECESKNSASAPRIDEGKEH
jgi:phosphopantetheine--protein transferase-like protein